ncbi:hypothetical protein ACOME3_004181 [Neoechinorhynchus agilis]
MQSLIGDYPQDYLAYRRVYGQAMNSRDENAILKQSEKRCEAMTLIEQYYIRVFEHGDIVRDDDFMSDLIGVIRKHKLDYRKVHANGVRFAGMCEPHHQGTEAEVKYLLYGVGNLLKSFRQKPAMIAIAKSVGRCPVDQSALILRMLQEMLDEHYAEYNPVHFICNESISNGIQCENDPEADKSQDISDSLSAIDLSTDDDDEPIQM